MSALRRYEILAPLTFNDGRPVPGALLAQTFSELKEKFGAALKTAPLSGVWEEKGETFRDKLTLFYVDVPDLPAHNKFFLKFKQTLKRRFAQLDIRITSHPIETL
ncbi:MAG TPA: hypothetical protein VHB20_19440 [Verrucomicrobiae bacterium]|jgi:hypothetical protein|nr:hypothetical protein [Verrucomicrobiae bacterium]